jgi:rubredoxin
MASPKAVQHLERAYELEAQDALAEALRHCDAALALVPGWAEAHNLRGIVLEALGRREEAVESFRRAVRLDPEEAEFRDNLEGAERDLERAGRDREGAERDLEGAGYALEGAGHDAEFQPALDQRPGWPIPLAPGEDLVTIATFWFPLQAYIAKGRLDWEGIWSMVADDNIIQANWLYCLAIGGVKLRVKESDAAAALEALQPQPVNQLWLEEQAGPDDMRCPDCGSVDVHFERLSIRGVFVSWVLTGPALFLIEWILLVGFANLGAVRSWLLVFLASLRFIVPTMASGIPLPVLKNKWHCDHCGGEWRDKDLEEVPEEDESNDDETRWDENATSVG